MSSVRDLVVWRRSVRRFMESEALDGDAAGIGGPCAYLFVGHEPPAVALCTFRDAADVHHVPKLKLDDVNLQKRLIEQPLSAILPAA